MAVLQAEQVAVAMRSDGCVVMALPVGDRKRQIVFSAEAAQRVGSVLANAGFDALGHDPGFARVSMVRLRPYDQTGDAMLELTLDDFGGPVAVTLGPEVLLALAQAAQAALEFGHPAGKA